MRITNPAVLRRIAETLGLDMDPSVQFQVPPQLVLSLGLDEIIPAFKAKYDAGGISVTSTGYKVLWTVPENTYIRLYMARAWLASGTFTIDKIDLSFYEASGQTNNYKSQTAATDIITWPNPPVPMRPGDIIRINVAAKTVNGTANSMIFYEEVAS